MKENAFRLVKTLHYMQFVLLYNVPNDLKIAENIENVDIFKHKLRVFNCYH